MRTGALQQVFRRGNVTMEIRRKNIMPLVSAPFKPGTALEFIDTIEDYDEKQMALADYYQYTGKAKKAVDIAKRYLNSEDIRYRLYRPGQSEETFRNQLEEILLPVYESARNMGFREWIYK